MKTDIAEKKVAILVDNYFEQAEFATPLRQLKNEAVEVTVIGTATKDLQAMEHADQADAFQADLVLDEADSNDYDALVLPGGVINADKLRMNETARLWVKKFLDEGKVVAVICHAPWLLVSADRVRDRRLTSYYTLQDDIRNAGGEWVDQEVVIDGTLITSRKPDDLPAFCSALIALLQKQHEEQLTKEVYNA
jgi:protease I